MTEYYIVNPTGNITALVTDNVAERNDRINISNEIMRINPSVEQVGFVNVKNGELSLDMAGGEFCGNATMSAAALYCHMNDKSDFCGFVTVSGAKNKIKTTVQLVEDKYFCSIVTDKPQSIADNTYTADGFDYTLPTVNFEGISHIIAPVGFDTGIAQKILKRYAKILNLPAMGVMIYDKKTNEMTPIVYVKECDTCIFETSCASGSCAVCAFLTQNEKESKRIKLVEPGGVLEAESCGGADYIKLYGSAKIEGKYRL